MFSKEEEMYKPIAKWLKEEVGCRIVMYENDPRGYSPITFRHHKNWKVDVAGRKSWELHAIEAKVKFDSTSFAVAIHQAKYYQKAFNFVYICFPMDELHEKINTEEKMEFREMVRTECVKMNIGLISVDDMGHLEIEQDKDAKDIFVDDTKTNPNLDLRLYQQVMDQLSFHLTFPNYQSRALLVRDLVILVVTKNLILNESDLATKFESESEYVKFDTFKGQNFRKATVDDKGISTVNAAINLGLIVDDEDTGFLKATPLGEILVIISKDDELWNHMSLAVKAFFYSIIQQFDTIKWADEIIQIESEKGNDVPQDELKNTFTELLNIPLDEFVLHFAANSGIVPFKWVRGEDKWRYDENFLKE